MLMTPSGVDKGAIEPADLIEIDEQAHAIHGDGRPSAEALLHLPIYRHYPATVVLHTHSVWNTLLSMLVPAREEVLELSGYEMLKALAGVATHEHVERIPVLNNSQEMTALAAELSERCAGEPKAHAFLLRGHGLYTWGQTFEEAKRHLETLEFLFEIEARRRGSGVRAETL